MNKLQSLLYKKYITKDDEKKFLEYFLNVKNWNTKLARRTLHFGYEYNYKNSDLFKAEAIPEVFHDLIKRITEEKIMKNINQVIVNEYLPGQGISAHTDAKNFDNVILTISLGSKCIMEFSNDSDKLELVLPRRSMLIMKDEFRYDWKHAIPARKSDIINGKRKYRKTRYSITFRSVK